MRRLAPLAPLACASFVALGCGTSSSGPVGGPVVGAVDSHCSVNGVQTRTEVAMCIDLRDAGASSPDAADAAVSTDAADAADATAPADADDGGGGATMADCLGMQSGGGDFGATMCNSEGDDDDCKYHVAWSSSPIRRNSDVTFDVTATRRFDGQPALGADIQVEAFFNDAHPTPSVGIVTTESSGGHYRIGPVQFDLAGKWTVRFHLYQFCADTTEDSPHGHAAFYVSVP